MDVPLLRWLCFQLALSTMIHSQHCTREGGIKCTLFCRDHIGAVKARSSAMPLQGVHGNEVFRVIHCNEIPKLFWLSRGLTQSQSFFFVVASFCTNPFWGTCCTLLEPLKGWTQNMHYVDEDGNPTQPFEWLAERVEAREKKQRYQACMKVFNYLDNCVVCC